MECNLGLYLKSLEVAHSQALIVEKNCVWTSIDKHQHKSIFTLASLQKCSSGQRPKQHTIVGIRGALSNEQPWTVIFSSTYQWENIAVSGIKWCIHIVKSPVDSENSLDCGGLFRVTSRKPIFPAWFEPRLALYWLHPQRSQARHLLHEKYGFKRMLYSGAYANSEVEDYYLYVNGL